MIIEKCPEPVNFKKLFEYIPGEIAPQKRIYKGKTIFLVDKFPVKHGEKLLFTIEQTNSRYPQGFYISLESGYLKIDDDPIKHKGPNKFLLCEDCEVQLFTKEGHIFIANYWEETIYEEEASGHFQKEDGTFTHTKIFKYPEGKVFPCYINSRRWNQGLCNGAAMYSEDIPDGKRYFCNDGDEDDDFDDIIFTVKKVHLSSLENSKKDNKIN